MIQYVKMADECLPPINNVVCFFLIIFETLLRVFSAAAAASSATLNTWPHCFACRGFARTALAQASNTIDKCQIAYTKRLYVQHIISRAQLSENYC